MKLVADGVDQGSDVVGMVGGFDHQLYGTGGVAMKRNTTCLRDWLQSSLPWSCLISSFFRLIGMIGSFARDFEVDVRVNSECDIMLVMRRLFSSSLLSSACLRVRVIPMAALITYWVDEFALD